MPIIPPRLDDRSFEDLVEELIARIPAHTPEWVPQKGDPGRTLLELFAWLGDALLYRANLIPERQRLVFLKLLGKPLRPAIAAEGLISLSLEEPESLGAITLAKRALVSGVVDFETRTEVTVLPVTAECFYKRPLSIDEKKGMNDVLDGLREFHEIDGELNGYVSTPIFNEGVSNKSGLDIVQDTIDSCLWLALLAKAPEEVEATKKIMAGEDIGKQQILNIGVAPAIDLPESFDELVIPGRVPHVWEISTPREEKNEPVYSRLSRINDSSNDLTRRGVDSYTLPGDPDDFGVLEGDVRKDANAGVGDRPPRLDDPEKIARVVAWLRLRPTQKMQSLNLSWVGINAVQIDQRQTLLNRVIGQSDGRSDQVFKLPGQSVEKSSFVLQVEEVDRGYVLWRRVDDLATVGRDDAVYQLDSEAGVVTFGNGLFGRVPDPGRRIRVQTMRHGGGASGNLPVGSLSDISAKDLDDKIVNQKIKVIQGVSTEGGADPETLAEAERRIPGWLKHKSRAVTEADYKTLAKEVPGVRVGRIEILPRFMPQQRRHDVAGVVSVMVLPFKEQKEAPNPRPDQPFIEKVYSYLNERRPLATELYVISCEYIPVGLSVGVTVREGFGHNEVENKVCDAMKRYLWSLSPEGPFNEGWPLGKNIKDNELEVIVAGVPGVNTVGGVNLFVKNEKEWKLLSRKGSEAVEIRLTEWQLPELLSVVVSTNTDGVASDELRASPVIEGGVGVPIVPEVC